jgi:aquaporin related protein
MGDILSEFLGTFIFVCTILIVVHDATNFTPNSFLCWLIIAVALFFSRHFAIHTGGCLNPAVAIGLQLSTGVIMGNWHALANCWVFIIGPILGAVGAAIYYDMVYQPFYPRKTISN